MTDIRRTVLWVVFTMSLILLWDGWQKHNGQPSMFSPTVATPVATASGVSAGNGNVPTPTAVPGSVAAPTLTGPAALVGEKVLITTDVLHVTLDTLGGDVIRVELPKYLSTHETEVFESLKQMVG